MDNNFDVEVRESKVKTILHDKYGDYAATVSYDDYAADDSMIGAIKKSVSLAREDRKVGWPKYNDRYYTPDFSKPELVSVENWRASSFDCNLKSQGLVFRKKDEAVLAAKKMLEAISDK